VGRRDRDAGAGVLLDLDGQVFVVDTKGQYWVRFSVRRVASTPDRPHGLNYSLTLHGPDGIRLVGFDNAHAVRESHGRGGKRRGSLDHRHRMETVRPYRFKDAATLLEDFWAEVDKLLREKGVILMKTLRAGIATYEQMKARTLAIARCEFRPPAGEPKVWFTSAESFARVLSDRNRALLGIIAESKPGSLAHLAELSGRKKSNLSRTLKTMERYGFVELRRGARGSVVPRVPYQRISLTVALLSPARVGTEAA
jgi:predicted transcriptional regulator